MLETFYKQIVADPHDAAVRLVLADWLDEHGGAADRDLAEFIRLQYEIAKVGRNRPRIEVNYIATRGAKGYVYLPLGSVSIDQRFDLHLTNTDNGRLKSDWHGLLATKINNTLVDFLVDEHSLPWTGWTLLERETQLSTTHLEKWLDAMPRCFGDSGMGRAKPYFVMNIRDADGMRVMLGFNPGRFRDWCVHFYNGFVEKVWLPFDQWNLYGDGMRMSFPLKTVSLSSMPDADWTFRNAPHPTAQDDLKLRTYDALHRRWPRLGFELP